MEFKTIETQEELDKIVQKRLAKEQAKHEKEVESLVKEYEGKHAEYEQKIAEYEKAAGKAAESEAGAAKRIEELETRIKGYETASVKTKIALEMGIPYELAGKLTGETEDDIRKDAQTFSRFVSQKEPTPLADTESGGSDDSYKQILNGLKGE